MATSRNAGGSGDDAAGRSVWMGPAPRLPAARLVSLVPSLTDAVFRLGAGPALVARTEYCVRPRGEVERLETVGGTKNLDVARILALDPDVVLANREENTRRRVERIAERVPVLLTDPRGPRDVPGLWRELGGVTGAATLASRLAAAVESALESPVDGAARPTFVCWIWRDPWMAVGHRTYISELLETVGWRNALPSHATRYPKLEPGAALALGPDVLLFASEPYEFELPRDLDAFGGGFHMEDEQVWRRADAPAALSVDGERLSWYPSLTLEGLEYAAELRWRVG